MDARSQLHAPIALTTDKQPTAANGQEAEWVLDPVWTGQQTEKSLPLL